MDLIQYIRNQTLCRPQFVHGGTPAKTNDVIELFKCLVTITGITACMRTYPNVYSISAIFLMEPQNSVKKLQLNYAYMSILVVMQLRQFQELRPQNSQSTAVSQGMERGRSVCGGSEVFRDVGTMPSILSYVLRL